MKFFTVDDFKGIKMPMTNGKITTDIVRLDEALTLINRLLPEKLELIELKCDRDPYELQKTLPGWEKPLAVRCPTCIINEMVRIYGGYRCETCGYQVPVCEDKK